MNRHAAGAIDEVLKGSRLHRLFNAKKTASAKHVIAAMEKAGEKVDGRLGQESDKITSFARFGSYQESCRCLRLDDKIQCPLSTTSAGSLITKWGFANITHPAPVVALLWSHSWDAIMRTVDEDGWNLLHWAAFQNHLEVVNAFCDEGIFLEASAGTSPSGEFYLKCAASVINQPNSNGETAFALALRMRHLKVAAQLARSSVFRFDAQTGPAMGWTRRRADGAVAKGPLWRLSACRTLETARDLVKFVDVSEIDLATDFGCLEINWVAVRAVLEAMQEVQKNSVRSDGSGIDLSMSNAKRHHGDLRPWPILFHAIRHQQGDVIDLVLRHRPNIDLSTTIPLPRSEDTSAETALHLAVRIGYVYGFGKILEHCESATILDSCAHGDALTVRELARRENNEAIVAQIEEFDAAIKLLGVKAGDLAGCRKAIETFTEARKCPICME